MGASRGNVLKMYWKVPSWLRRFVMAGGSAYAVSIVMTHAHDYHVQTPALIVAILIFAMAVAMACAEHLHARGGRRGRS